MMKKQQLTKILLLSLMLGWLITTVVFFNEQKGHLLVVIFLILAAGERFLETFFTSKQNILQKNSKFDWLFLLLTFCYLLIMYGSTIEIFKFKYARSLLISTLGLIFFSTALYLRWWAIRSLGLKWNSRISRKVLRKNTRIRFIRRGPYKYFRHPMYAGTMLELVGIPLVCNAYLSLLFAAFIGIPLLLARAVLEENVLLDKFGAAYRIYKNRTGSFIPKIGKLS
jgi:protein-S-isoprenylcysteine O-methyltransferase Ste14